MTAIPADVRALRALATPHVKTATLEHDTLPALVVSSGRRQCRRVRRHRRGRRAGSAGI
jgi:hypothetical protein